MINPVLITWTNVYISNLSVPEDPCLFNDYNLSELAEPILTQSIPAGTTWYMAALIGENPCEFWVIPEVIDIIIEPYDKNYLIDYDYWFNDNHGKCNIDNPEENQYDIFIMPCDKKCSYHYIQSIQIFFF